MLYLNRTISAVRCLQSSWFPVLLGIICLAAIGVQLSDRSKPAPPRPWTFTYIAGSPWSAPVAFALPADEKGDLIRYGRELITRTSFYLGPKGIVAARSNGMNCQNCHLDGGGRPFGNPFSAVASTYPKFRERSGRTESIEFRINECMERSMNGQRLDSLSTEMRAMVAYLLWVGQGVEEGVSPQGTGTLKLPLLARAADPARGQAVYRSKCQSCHGGQGEGVMMPDSTGYIYPPLWGSYSYNVSAGMYRLSRLAEFIRGNMPFGATWQNPQVSVEEAWDVAAYINSQPRPAKTFAYDWPQIAAKPHDHPFGPYADPFPEIQHKYGPFGPITEWKEKK